MSSSDPLEMARALVEERLRPLAQVGALETLDEEQLRLLGLPGGLGWRLTIEKDYTGASRRVSIGLPANFPISPPVARVTPNAYRVWPHAEREGGICLWPAGEAPVGQAVKSLIDRLFTQIRRVLLLVLPESSATDRQAEFDLEWLSYWPSPEGKPRGYFTVVMADIPDKPCMLYAKALTKAGRRPGSGQAWHPLVVLASHPGIIENWAESLLAFKSEEAQPLAIYANVKSPLPVGMPDSPEGVMKIFDAEARQLVGKALATAAVEKRPVWVILGASYEQGMAYAGVEFVPAPVPQPYRNPRYASKNESRNAFQARETVWKPHNVPVMRADADWMQSRSGMPMNPFGSARVAMVGAGALGSLVAVSLARAGIGHMAIIDHDTLDAANLGRHALNATYLGQPKSEGLAAELQAIAPPIKIHPFNKNLDAALAAGMDLNNYDVIVSTTASWPCELRLLSEAQSGKTMKPLLIAWAEPFGAAGHCLHVHDRYDDFIALFDADGTYRGRLSQWPESVIQRRIPACQATFQPGALVHIEPIATMVTKSVLDVLQGRSASTIKTWWTDQAFVKENGGEVNGTAHSAAPHSISTRRLSGEGDR